MIVIFLLLHFNYHKRYVECLLLSMLVRLFMVRLLCVAYTAHEQGQLSFHYPKKKLLKEMKDREKTLIGDPWCDNTSSLSSHSHSSRLS